MLTIRQQIKAMKAAGFTCIRSSGKHMIWQDSAGQKIITSTGTVKNWHNQRNFKHQLKRLVENREKLHGLQASAVSTHLEHGAGHDRTKGQSGPHQGRK